MLRSVSRLFHIREARNIQSFPSVRRFNASRFHFKVMVRIETEYVKTNRTDSNCKSYTSCISISNAVTAAANRHLSAYGCSPDRRNDVWTLLQFNGPVPPSATKVASAGHLTFLEIREIYWIFAKSSGSFFDSIRLFVFNVTDRSPF